MAKNLQKYFQAWLLRKKGYTLKKVGQEMGFSAERARVMINYVTFCFRKKNKDYQILKKIKHEKNG